MHSQTQLEYQASDALAALGTRIDHGTVSDAVDLSLCKLERDTGQVVDRDVISDSIAAEAIETATAWLLAISDPALGRDDTHLAVAPGTMATMYLIGTGPSELHAHIDLDRRLHNLGPHDGAAASVVSTAHAGGNWSVVAEIRPDTVGERR